MITSEEKNYLRELAKKLQNITLNEKWRQLEQDWKDLNRLKGRRTMIYSFMINDVWAEILHPSKTLKTKEPLLREIEYDIVKRIYRAEHFHCDTIIYPDIYVPIEYKFTDWVENRQKPFADFTKEELRKAEAYHPVLESTDDIKKLRKPELEYLDWKKTNEGYEMVCDILGDILPVHKGCPFGAHTDSEVFGWGMSIIDVLAELRGLESLFYDFYEEPEFLHETLAFMQEGYQDYIDTMEKEHLFIPNHSAYIGVNAVSGGEGTSTGENGLAVTDELPGKDYDPENVMAKDLWGYCQGQELTDVSGDMRSEFCLDYQKPIAERFGMLAYGCCENNDFNYDNILNTFSKNLRVVSVPYCSNLQIAAERLKDHVMAWRPLTEPIGMFNEEKFRNETMKSMEIMKDNNAAYWCGAPLTLEGQPEVLETMTKIVRECSEAFARS